jgi:peptidoglycan hydrolase-like protein with peptidoglycan-binding domain
MNQEPILKKGSTGKDVKRVQRILVMLKLLVYTGIDGSFGTNTENAVRVFQESKNLTVDGIVGSATWSAFPADPGTVELAIGASGAVVISLQQGLKRFSGQTDPGSIDGSFGSKTEAAVRAYQSVHGLTVDGIVGDRTWWVPAGAAGATLASLSGLTTA